MFENLFVFHDETVIFKISHILTCGARSAPILGGFARRRRGILHGNSAPKAREIFGIYTGETKISLLLISDLLNKLNKKNGGWGCV